MIVYNPLDGDVIGHHINTNPRHCFLITQLGKDHKPDLVNKIHKSISQHCAKLNYKVIDAGHKTTGKDFLLKIWKLIASVPICIAIVHEDTPIETQANIYYEIGVAQALGKEVLIIKSPKAKIASDFIRTEWLAFDDEFDSKFNNFMQVSIMEQALHYEDLAEALENNPVLAFDYLKRAYLITGDKKYQTLIEEIRNKSFNQLAKNSVEYLASQL